MYSILPGKGGRQATNTRIEATWSTTRGWPAVGWEIELHFWWNKRKIALSAFYMNNFDVEFPYVVMNKNVYIVLTIFFRNLMIF